MARYQLIRNKKVADFEESQIEVCDTKEEINDFSIKEIITLLAELKEFDYKDEEIYVDLYSLLKNIQENNSIDQEKIEKVYQDKLKTEGPFSKFLLKIN